MTEPNRKAPYPRFREGDAAPGQHPPMSLEDLARTDLLGQLWAM